MNLWTRDETHAASDTLAFLRPVVLFHLATRVITLTFLVVASRKYGSPLSEAISAWDGKWYQIVAESGYPESLPTNNGMVVTNPTGFFPLFPYLLRPFIAVGVPFHVAAGVLVLACSTTAAMLIALVVRRYTSNRVGQLTAYCWSVFPTASVLSVAYSEALFTMLAAGCILLLLRGNWILAGSVAALAGATRPTGIVLVAAVVITSLDAIARRREWKSLWAAAIAPLGTILGLGIIALSAHRIDAWFITQREGWRVRFDGGISLVKWAWTSLTGEFNAIKLAFTVAVLVGASLALIAALRRPPVPVLVFLVLGTILALGQGGAFYLSPLRFLLPIFPLLVPLAQWLSARQRSAAGAVLWLAALCSAAVGVYYFLISSGAP